MRRFSVCVAALIVFALSAYVHAGIWDIDPAHTNVQFKVRHLMLSNVRGEFEKVAGTVEIDDNDVTKSVIPIIIDATTIDTRVPKRNRHLKSPDFLDVAKYPTITFKSKKIIGLSDESLKVIGELTIRGVTRE